MLNPVMELIGNHYWRGVAAVYLKEYLKARKVPSKLSRAEFEDWLTEAARSSYPEQEVLKGFGELIKAAHLSEDGRGNLDLSPAFHDAMVKWARD